MFRRSNDRGGEWEDPRELLDYFYQWLVEDVTPVRHMVADLATNSKRIELEMIALEQRIIKLKDNLAEAQKAEKADLVQEIEIIVPPLERALHNLEQRYNVAKEHEREATLDSLTRQALKDSFRVNKEGFKAEYNFAKSVSPPSREYGTHRGKIEDRLDDQETAKIAAIIDLLYPDSANLNDIPDEG
jgi:phage shock protein A